ncbi:MAG: hypothetical protein RIC52_11130 [Amphiplicatus sp.]
MANGNDGNEPEPIGPNFNGRVSPQEEWPKHPAPGDLIKAGITTEAALDHRSLQEPEVPAPEPTPDDPEGWRTARIKALQEQAKTIAEDRRRFHDRSSEMREEFAQKSRTEPDLER